MITKEQFLSILRHFLSALGGIATANGFGNDELMLQVTGGLMMFAAAMWGIVSKKS
jgi:hypothetical protein